MTMLVNKRSLSEILGISEQTLTAWQEQGLPMVSHGGRGSKNEYEPAKCIRWWLDRELAKAHVETPRDRLARVQADRVEMDMAVSRGELIAASEVGPAWSGMIIAARQELLALPQNAAPLLAQMDGTDAMRDLLEEMVEGALRKLSEDDEPGSTVTDPVE